MKAKIRKGYKYDFVYSESSTMPTILADPDHVPRRPLLDWAFFNWCNREGIPIGLFYRDVYWRFPAYADGRSIFSVMGARLAYRFDLWMYRRTLKILYMPSLEMAKHVPGIKQMNVAALPPGHVESLQNNDVRVVGQSRPLKLFYVGGLSAHYRMHTVFEVARRMPQIELTVCTRKAEWMSVQSEYGSLTPNIRVIHESGTDMLRHLHRCDVALLFVEPHEYRDFAEPVKLYEYAGCRKPIIASEGTYAGRVVSNNEIGWTIPYTSQALSGLLYRLLKAPREIREVLPSLSVFSARSTWKERARKVVADMTT